MEFVIKNNEASKWYARASFLKKIRSVLNSILMAKWWKSETAKRNRRKKKKRSEKWSKRKNRQETKTKIRPQDVWKYTEE